MGKIEIKKVVITLPSGDIELTVEQVKELKSTLDNIISNTTINYPIHYTSPWYTEPYPVMPWYTWQTDNFDTTVSSDTAPAGKLL